MAALRRLPSMKLLNVQTNNSFVLTDREQIGNCLEQTFNSQVSTERWVDGKKEEVFITRPIPKYEILECDKELSELIPIEEATLSIRQKLLGKDAVKIELKTIEGLKKYCYEKGIHHHPSISYEKLLAKVNKYEELNAERKEKEDETSKTDETILRKKVTSNKG